MRRKYVFRIGILFFSSGACSAKIRIRPSVSVIWIFDLKLCFVRKHEEVCWFNFFFRFFFLNISKAWIRRPKTITKTMCWIIFLVQKKKGLRIQFYCRLKNIRHSHFCLCSGNRQKKTWTLKRRDRSQARTFFSKQWTKKTEKKYGLAWVAKIAGLQTDFCGRIAGCMGILGSYSIRLCDSRPAMEVVNDGWV